MALVEAEAPRVSRGLAMGAPGFASGRERQRRRDGLQDLTVGDLRARRGLRLGCAQSDRIARTVNRQRGRILWAYTLTALVEGR